MALNVRRFFLFLPWLVVGLVVATLWLWQTSEPEPAQVATCADLQVGCELHTQAGRIVVRVEGKLQVLKPFRLLVEAPGARGVHASFAMGGMDMGFNRYVLQRTAPGAFQGHIVLPVCVSGRRDWLMSLEIDGRRIDIPFVTELS